MKRNRLFIIIMALVVLALCAPAALAQKSKDKDKDKDKDRDYDLGERIERAVAAAPNVVVTVCMSSGDIVVNGWDKNEVRVVALSARQLELQGGANGAAQRIDVSVSNMTRPGEESLLSHCRGISNLEINVPRGAVVEIKTHAGNLEVNQVSEARLNTIAGDVTLGNITRAVEARTIAGDIDLSSSAGRINLSTVSGDIDATDVRSLEAGDDFLARTTSGDINLVNVAQSRVSAVTTSGLITLTGALTRGGSYDLKTYSGDIVLNLPANSSFRVTARAPRGQIVTEFQLKSASEEDARDLLEGRRLSGMVGSGDATLSLDTFVGTVRLQKR